MLKSICFVRPETEVSTRRDVIGIPKPAFQRLEKMSDRLNRHFTSNITEHILQSSLGGQVSGKVFPFMS